MRLNLRLAVEHVKCSFKMPITRLQSLQRDFFTAYDGKLKVTNYNKKQVQKSNMSTEYNRKYGYSVHAQFIQRKRPNLIQPYSFNKKSVTE